MKPFTIAVLSIVCIMILTSGSWVLKAALLPAKTVTTQIDSASEIIDKTYDADNAVYNYEWFKQQHQDILAQKNIIDNMMMELDSYEEYGPRSEWGYETTRSYNSLNSKLTGTKNYYDKLVADYNARASMANRNIFQDKLPLYIDKILW